MKAFRILIIHFIHAERNATRWSFRRNLENLAIKRVNINIHLSRWTRKKRFDSPRWFSMWNNNSQSFFFFFPYFATSIMLHPCEGGLYDTYRGKKIFLHPPVFFKVNHHTRWWNWKFDDIIGGSGSRSTKESYYLSCHYLSSACPLKKSLSSSSLLIEYAPFPVKIFQRRRKVAFPSRKLAVEENFHLQLKGAYTSSLETHVANEGRAFGFEREAFNEKRGAHVAVGRIRI